MAPQHLGSPAANGDVSRAARRAWVTSHSRARAPLLLRACGAARLARSVMLQVGHAASSDRRVAPAPRSRRRARGPGPGPGGHRLWLALGQPPRSRGHLSSPQRRAHRPGRTHRDPVRPAGGRGPRGGDPHRPPTGRGQPAGGGLGGVGRPPHPGAHPGRRPGTVHPIPRRADRPAGPPDRRLRVRLRQPAARGRRGMGHRARPAAALAHPAAALQPAGHRVRGGGPLPPDRRRQARGPDHRRPRPGGQHHRRQPDGTAAAGPGHRAQLRGPARCGRVRAHAPGVQSGAAHLPALQRGQPVARRHRRARRRGHRRGSLLDPGRSRGGAAPPDQSAAGGRPPARHPRRRRHHLPRRGQPQGQDRLHRAGHPRADRQLRPGAGGSAAGPPLHHRQRPPAHVARDRHLRGRADHGRLPGVDPQPHTLPGRVRVGAARAGGRAAHRRHELRPLV